MTMEPPRKLMKAIEQAINGAVDKNTSFNEVALALVLCLSDTLEELSPKFRLATIAMIAIDKETAIKQVDTIRDRAANEDPEDDSLNENH